MNDPEPLPGEEQPLAPRNPTRSRFISFRFTSAAWP